MSEYILYIYYILINTIIHFRLKLEEGKKPASSEASAEVTLMVGGQPLPEMSPDQMREVIRSALNTFDMMECVLSQLKEVIDRKTAKK
jgi:hypothetical protein